MVKSD